MLQTFLAHSSTFAHFNSFNVSKSVPACPQIHKPHLCTWSLHLSLLQAQKSWEILIKTPFVPVVQESREQKKKKKGQPKGPFLEEDTRFKKIRNPPGDEHLFYHRGAAGVGSEGTIGMIEGVEQHRLEELLWLLMNLLNSPGKTSVPGHDSQLLVGRKI